MEQLQQQPQPSVNVVNIPGQPANVQYVLAAPHPPPRPAVYPHFPEKPAVSVGVTLIVAGILSIIFNIVEIAVGVITSDDQNNYYSSTWLFGYIGHGFWVGIMCVIPGGIGIGAGFYKTRSRICAFNVMCVIAAAFCTAQFSIGLTGAIVGPECYSSFYGNWQCGNENVAIAMEALQTVLAVVEAIVAIYGSSLCCRTYCCCSCCETKTMSLMPSYGTPIAYISGDQHLSPLQYPVAIPAYQNVAYQPGYPGQPVQFTTLPPAYSVQGQYIAAGHPPNYAGTSQNVNPAMIGGVQAFSTQAGQLQTTTAAIHQQQAYAPPISTTMVRAK